MTLHRILVPLDGSAAAEAILAALMPIVRERPAKVHLLAVLKAPDLPPRAGPYLAKACKGLRAHEVEVGWDLRLGRPAATILAYAHECGADLIAMSTHGRSGLSRLLLGSTTEEVLRHSEIPLLVCRPGTASRQGNVVLAALDGSPEAEAVLPDAAKLARAVNGELHLVHVAVPYVAVGGFGDFPMKYSSEDPFPYLQEVARRFEHEGIALQTKACVGGAAGELLRYAGETGAAMICMTTHGRTGVERLLMGSVAEEVLRGAPCPVLVRRTVASAVAATH